MLILDNKLTGMLQSRAGTIINLYELHYHNDAEPVRFANDSEDMQYQGNTYYMQALKHSDLSYDGDGSVRDITLVIGNAERQMQYYIERYDLLNKRVVIKQVYINTDGEVLGDISSSYIIKSISVTSTQAEFTLSMGFDMFKAVVPARRIFARFCGHMFRDESCKYTGKAESCAKNFSDCKRKKNTANFGGFPGVKNERLYF